MDKLASNTSNLMDLDMSGEPMPVAVEKKDDLIDDHSQMKGEIVGNLQKNSNSTDDFEHVDQDLLMSSQTDKKLDIFDDFLMGSKKNTTDDVKGATQNFLAFESSGDFAPKPTLVPTPAPILTPEEPKKQEAKADVEILGEPESDYLNPYNDIKNKKHLNETNEKFISSEDLIAPFKDVEEIKDPKTIKPDPVSFLDTTNYDDTDPIPIVPVKEPVKVPTPEPVVEKPAPAPEPIIEKPKPDPVQAPAPVLAPAPKVEEEKQVQLIEAEKMFKQIGLVESLIYWRDVKKSGIVFGTGLAILLAMSLFSLISVFSYVSLLVLFGTVAFRIYKNVLQAVQKTSEGHPFKQYLEADMALSAEKVQDVTSVAVAHLNALVTELRRLFLVEDLVDSIKFGVLLYCLTYVGAIFNGMTCVIIAFVALFTLPKVYENNKQSIDGYLDIVRSKILEVTEKVKSAVPIGKKTESEKDK